MGEWLEQMDQAVDEERKIYGIPGRSAEYEKYRKKREEEREQEEKKKEEERQILAARPEKTLREEVNEHRRDLLLTELNQALVATQKRLTYMEGKYKQVENHISANALVALVVMLFNLYLSSIAGITDIMVMIFSLFIHIGNTVLIYNLVNWILTERVHKGLSVPFHIAERWQLYGMKEETELCQQRIADLQKLIDSNADFSDEDLLLYRAFAEKEIPVAPLQAVNLFYESRKAGVVVFALVSLFILPTSVLGHFLVGLIKLKL